MNSMTDCTVWVVTLLSWQDEVHMSVKRINNASCLWRFEHRPSGMVVVGWTVSMTLDWPATPWTLQLSRVESAMQASLQVWLTWATVTMCTWTRWWQYQGKHTYCFVITFQWLMQGDNIKPRDTVRIIHATNCKVQCHLTRSSRANCEFQLMCQWIGSAL